MPRYGARIDPITGSAHAPVAQATDYSRITPLRQVRVAGGTIDIALITSASPGARRYVRMLARYKEGDTDVEHTVICRDELDEATTLRRLEREIAAASTLPTPGA